MASGSLLTQGLESLGGKSETIRSKLNELYALDEDLQVAHQQAKRDDEFGEEVVTKYKVFLSCRQELIAELEKQQIPVPWQLRMTIDDLELTLHQRREKKEGKSSSSTKENANLSSSKENSEPEEKPHTTHSGRVAVAFIGPTLFALVAAILWYNWSA